MANETAQARPSPPGHKEAEPDKFAFGDQTMIASQFSRYQRYIEDNGFDACADEDEVKERFQALRVRDGALSERIMKQPNVVPQMPKHEEERRIGPAAEKIRKSLT